MTKTRLRRIFLILILSASLVPAAIYVRLYLKQDSLIFNPRPMTEQAAGRLSTRYPGAEEITLKRPEGIRLRGWFLKNSKEAKSPLLIYFLGNADEASEFLPDASWLEGWSMALINYRGYGLSEGRPSEKAFFEDAVFIYDSLSKRDGIDPGRIAALGRSLGTGVAVHLASMRPLRGVILVSPYDSIRAVAQGMHPYAPVSLLIRHPFDALSVAPKAKAPLLALVASKDETIRPEHSMRLVGGWGGKSRVILINGADHNSIFESGLYRESIVGFLNGL